MPLASFSRVREVSSEDNIHLAVNLIKNQPGKKWKTKNPGEKSAYVILEMSDCEEITGIDIGNEHSAFVEVLVGKSSCAPEDFTEILITCSFMTPTESRSSNNSNRVRCFNREALVPTVADNKWSLVKILCTQPFNKHVQYGLSFIKVHINDNEKKKLVPDQFLNTTAEVISKLKFRADTPDSDNENCSSLFNRWKKSKDTDSELTAAASIRMAAKNPIALTSHRLSDVQKPQTTQPEKIDDSILDRNREKLLFGNETNDTNNKTQKKLERLSEVIKSDKQRRRMEKEKEMIKNKSKSLDLSASEEMQISQMSTKPSSSKPSTNSSTNNVTLDSVKKRQSSPPENTAKKMKPLKKYRPFNQLLKDVVLVISGIQNPDRANLRNKAIALGAKYKADWDSTCTHLICAFKNTPKYNQVKGKGKIVARSWIEKCYSTKKYLPWRRYALDSLELSKPESDEEIFDESQKSGNEEISNDISLKTSTEEEFEDKSNTLILYDIDDRHKNNKLSTNYNASSSETDTDDEITRIQQKARSPKGNETVKNVNIYEASTDEEDYIKERVSQRK